MLMVSTNLTPIHFLAIYTLIKVKELKDELISEHQGQGCSGISHINLIVLLIIVSILLVYSQVGSHEFINFDDQLYVTDNPVAKAGITWDGIKWAFSFSDRTSWHPLHGFPIWWTVSCPALTLESIISRMFSCISSTVFCCFWFLG